MSADILVDTHVMLWLALDDPRWEPVLGDVIDDPASTVTISAVTYHEIAIKRAIGKLPIGVRRVRSLARRAGMLELPLSVDHAEQFEQLPLHHRDPFDRMLVAQARAEDLAIATLDPMIARYDVELFSN